MIIYYLISSLLFTCIILSSMKMDLLHILSGCLCGRKGEECNWGLKKKEENSQTIRSFEDGGTLSS